MHQVDGFSWYYSASCALFLSQASRYRADCPPDHPSLVHGQTAFFPLCQLRQGLNLGFYQAHSLTSVQAHEHVSVEIGIHLHKFPQTNRLT